MGSLRFRRPLRFAPLLARLLSKTSSSASSQLALRLLFLTDVETKNRMRQVLLALKKINLLNRSTGQTASMPLIDRILLAISVFSGITAIALSVLPLGAIPSGSRSEPLSQVSPQATEEDSTNNAQTQPPHVQAKAARPRAENQGGSENQADPELVSLLGRLISDLRDDSDPSGSKSELSPPPDFNRDDVLNDFDNRISDQFSIPVSLRDRVGFWFDVYTKYDSNRRIIHHGRYPWIIFKVVDVSPIINADTPRRRWMRNEKADKIVASEAQKIRLAVRSLAARRSLNDLNEYELAVSNGLRSLGSNIQALASAAISEVRVQTGQRNYFAEGIRVSPRYLGTMEEIFRKHKLPTELTRIPFVESSFNKQATSKVGASGIWQFMGNTGRKFMVIRDGIDERRSPFKATEAAARLLKENHMILYRSWPLAITAWNHGPSGIRKASKAAGSRDLAEIVSRYRSRSFDFASSNFYAEFLAALHAEKYNSEVFGNIERESALSLHPVALPRSMRVGQLVRASGLSLSEFILLNPDLRSAVGRDVVLPAGFRIHVPSDARASLERRLAMSSVPIQDSST
jgi:membrane-bound lytic murein transglycosylase D